MKKILFVCTGNTCRSPMAEAIFNSLAVGANLSASSCGIYGDGISPISDNAKKALSEIGIDFEHISSPITERLVNDADFIFGMSESHARNIMAMFPGCAEKVYVLPKDIPDPYGSDIEAYRACRDEIEICIKQIIKTLLGEEND